MESSNVANRVRAIIIEQLGVDPARATDDASIVDDLGADSLEVAQIVMMIEDEFNIEIQMSRLTPLLRLEMPSTSSSRQRLRANQRRRKKPMTAPATHAYAKQQSRE